MLKNMLLAAALVPSLACAAETKDVEYRKFIDAFHLTDFLENKSDITSITRIQYELQPENKDLTWRDVSFIVEGQEYKPNRWFGLDLPVNAELYARNPMMTRTSRLPGAFHLGMELVVVGAGGQSVDSAMIRRARDHYDDLIAHAGFTVRNFAPSMDTVIVHGEAAEGRCHIEGEGEEKSFGEVGEIKFELKKVLKPESKQIACSTPISEVLLDAD